MLLGSYIMYDDSIGWEALQREMEYESIKAENEIKKLVQETQEKVMFPSYLFIVHQCCCFIRKES